MKLRSPATGSRRLRRRRSLPIVHLGSEVPEHATVEGVARSGGQRHGGFDRNAGLRTFALGVASPRRGIYTMKRFKAWADARYEVAYTLNDPYQGKYLVLARRP